MTQRSYLGIDTSAYTTSVAMVDDTGQVLADARKLLDVKPGERGLRQSEAFFQHVNALPERLKAALITSGRPELSAIAVSVKPRDLEDSYMPVFQAGLRLAESLSVALDLPLYHTTHQDGHLMAGCHAHPDLLSKPFLAVHLSGGTTEILSCDFTGTGFKAQLLGGTRDLSYGQLIDRIGVRMGLGFPAGKTMEAMIEAAAQGPAPLEPLKFPRVTPQNWFNLSGLENKACQLLDAGHLPAQVAAGLLDCLAQTLLDVVRQLMPDLNPEIKDILIIGGVAANQRLREALNQGFDVLEPPLVPRYATPAFSSDNAIGVALIARARDRMTRGARA